MKNLLRCVIPLILLFSVCGCDFMDSDEAPPLVTPTKDPKTDYDTAVMLYNEGKLIYEQAKTSEDDKWGLCRKAMWKFRDSKYLLQHYIVNPPQPLTQKEVNYYFGEADSWHMKMKNCIRPGGKLPTPDSR
ncbi:MAG: hypothetical protein ACYS8W_06630 [Planctomycetota bacterium]|jgi:hypothetical protein